MRRLIRKMLLEGFTKDDILKDERVQEKKCFQFPPRIDVPHQFYDKSAGIKRRKENMTVKKKKGAAPGRNYGTYGD